MPGDRVLRGTPPAVWVLCALLGMVGFAWSVVLPLLHGPDEGAHVDRIATVDDQLGRDPTIQLTYSTDLVEALRRINVVAVDHRVVPVVPWVPLSPDGDAPRGERPTYPGLASPADLDNLNAAGSGPPLYYWLVDEVDALTGVVGVGGIDEVGWARTLGLWRLLSALLLACLPWLTWATARRLGMAPSTALTAAALPLAIPQLGQSAGTVNNDALLLPAVWLAILASVWLATGGLTTRWAVVAGIGAGIGMGAKVFGLPAPLWIAAALVAAPFTGPGGRAVGWAVRLRLLGIAALATLATGGWWPTLHLVTNGTPAPRDFAYPQPDVADASVLPWLGDVVTRLSSTGWGSFGIEQFGLPGWVVTLATVVGLIALALGTVRFAREQRAALTALLWLPLATILLMVLVAAWGGYARSGLPIGLHGRYLFAALPAILPLAALGWHAVAEHRLDARIATMACVLASLGLQLSGLWVALRNYWPGDLRDQVRTAMVRSGWNDAVLGLAILTSLAIVVWLVVGLRRTDPEGATA